MFVDEVRSSSDGIPLVRSLQAVGELGVGVGWAEGGCTREGVTGCAGVGYAITADWVVADWAES